MKYLGKATTTAGVPLGEAPTGKAPSSPRRHGGAHRQLLGQNGEKSRRKRKDQNEMKDGKDAISISKTIANWTGPRTVLIHAQDHPVVGDRLNLPLLFSRIVTGPRTDYFKTFQLNQCSVNCAPITLSDLQVFF